MKLFELTPPYPNDLVDPEDFNRDDDDKVDRFTMKGDDVESPRKDSNREKAKRIRTRAKMKAKDANPGNEDTPHQSHMGGHVSTTWLNR